MAWQDVARAAAPAVVALVLVSAFSMALRLIRAQRAGDEDPEAPSREGALRVQAALLTQRLRDMEEPYPAIDLYNLGRIHALLFDATGEPGRRRSALHYMGAARSAAPDFFKPQGRFYGEYELLPFGSLQQDPEFKEFAG